MECGQELRDGYRIPTIDEFVDGFSYEVYTEGHFDDGIEDFFGWYKYTIGEGNEWRHDEFSIRELGGSLIQDELTDGNIQVKINTTQCKVVVHSSHGVDKDQVK